MRVKNLAICALLMVQVSIATGMSYPNAPTLEFPDEAMQGCIVGRIKAQFRVVDGHPVGLKIVSSEPNGLYTDAFLKWWSAYADWLTRTGVRWGEDSPDGEPVTQEFTFEPCDT